MASCNMHLLNVLQCILQWSKGRPAFTLGSCLGVSSFTFYQYSRVCGRVIILDIHIYMQVQMQFANSDKDLEGMHIEITFLV